MNNKPQRPIEPVLPPAPPPVESEAAEVILRRYGERGASLMKGMAGIAESIKTSAESLIDHSSASIEAAKGMLRLLEEEQTVFATELKKYSEGMGEQITDFMARCANASQRMREERESFVKDAQSLASGPSSALVTADDEDQ